MKVESGILQDILRSWWYRLSLAVILLVPAGLCQTVSPVVPLSAWETLSEDTYATLLRYQKPKNDDPSRLMVIEVDQKTIDAYGWPIDRSFYAALLNRLKVSGHPWVLSLLHFQALDKAQQSMQSREQRTSQDKLMIAAIKDYERYVGTGLQVQKGSSLDADVEDELLPRVLLSNSGKIVEELPDWPLFMDEDPRIVEQQKAFGFGTRFGTEAVVRCSQMFITDKNRPGAEVLPSALVWATAYANEAQIRTAVGAHWPREGEKLPFALKKRLNVTLKECLPSPGMTTEAYLNQRGVERVSLVDFLTSNRPWELSDKLVLLAPAEGRRFRGPGVADGDDDGIVFETLLTARFLDGLLAGDLLRREEMSGTPLLDYLPLIAALGLSLGSLFLSTAGLIGLCAAVLLGFLGFAAIKLQGGIYIIPMQTLTSVAATTVLMSMLYAYLRYHGIRREIRFSSRLRTALSQCNTLDDLESLAFSVCQHEWPKSTLEFMDFDRDLYRATSDANAAIAWLDKQKHNAVASGDSQFGGRLSTVMTRVGKPSGVTRMPFRARGLNVQLAAESKLGRLGTIRMAIAYKPHEEGFVTNLLDALRTEVSQHWHRIKILADQKMLDYRYLREQTRNDIMARFLTKVLVERFSDEKSMEQNLANVLTPRPTRCALMQADIRGYSKLAAKLSPEQMVRLLQAYFRHTVDAAQLVAQVKLIGDCIFLFIEESAARPGVSPVDLALELASLLVSETEKQNLLRDQEGLERMNFGIAIHYGEVVVGNLSSDSCIDYTVIGPNVNLVARMEELTKDPKIKNIIGVNALIISPEAEQALLKHRGINFVDLRLDQLGAAIRSFSQIVHVRGLPAAQMTRIVPDDVQPGLKQKTAS